jgi:hypothetical protein
MSVSKLVSRGSTVSFEGKVAIVRNREGKSLLTAVKMNRLYVITSKASVVSANVAQTK